MENRSEGESDLFLINTSNLSTADGQRSDQSENGKRVPFSPSCEKIEHIEIPCYANSVMSTNNDKTLSSDKEDGGRRKRCNTIRGILENPLYINSLSCYSPDQRRLAKACREAAVSIRKEKTDKISSILVPTESETEVEQNGVEEGESPQLTHHMRNLIVVSLGFTIMYIATGSLRNLQSSINHEAGIGLYSLAASYASFMIGSLFTPFILKQFRPKRCMVLAIIPQTLYVASNVYPKFYVLIPLSALQGFGNSIMWNAVSTYITNLSKAAASKQNRKGEHITSKYFGIFFLILQWYVIIGNLVASLILRKSENEYQHKIIPLNRTLGSTLYQNYTNKDRRNEVPLNLTSFPKQTAGIQSHYLCGANYCHYYPIDHEGMKVDDHTKFMLLGVYTGCGVISFLVTSIFLEPLKTYKMTRVQCHVVSGQLIAVIKFFVDRRFMMIWLICMYGLMQNGFLTSEVTKAFVTCPLGISMVGYVMICFGVCGAISSYASGWLNKHVGRIALFCTAAATNLALMAFMLVWTPTSDIYVYFILFGIWGIGNGIWSSQVNSLVGTLFADRSEEAFASQRMLQGLGTTVGYFYAKHLCMMEKICILGGICVLGMILYIAMELLFLKNNKSEEIILKQTSV